MIMGSKTVKQEDALISIGGYILSILKDNPLNLDDLYEQLNTIYVKSVKFGVFINSLYFLFMIKKIKLHDEDYIEIIQ